MRVKVCPQRGNRHVRMVRQHQQFSLHKRTVKTLRMLAVSIGDVVNLGQDRGYNVLTCAYTSGLL
jgi:hypothetical protein